jgi:hypothetical protein
MIDRELAAFFQEGLAIQVGTRNERLEPNGVRAVALTVNPAGTHVVVYVPTVAAKQILPDLKDNGQAAIVLVRPTDEKSSQIKGVFEAAHEATDDEREIVLSQWGQLLEYFAAVGLPPIAVQSWITWPCVGIRLRVTALFNTTPGPGAGAAIT